MGNWQLKDNLLVDANFIEIEKGTWAQMVFMFDYQKLKFNVRKNDGWICSMSNSVNLVMGHTMFDVQCPFVWSQK